MLAADTESNGDNNLRHADAADALDSAARYRHEHSYRGPRLSHSH